jgi:hypothetical protein
MENSGSGHTMISALYFLIVAYFTAAFLVYMFRERKISAQISTALVLIMLLLRLFLIK